MSDHRKLEVWNRAQTLAAEAHRVAASCGREHQQLANDIRRSATSMLSNLAEALTGLATSDLAWVLDELERDEGDEPKPPYEAIDCERLRHRGSPGGAGDPMS